MKNEVDDDKCEFHELLSHLDNVAAAGREANAIRRDTGPRIPRAQDMEGPGWHPPPSREVVRQSITGQCSRRFNRTVKAAGEPFTKSSDIGFLKPKVLRQWVAERAVQPNRSFDNPNHKVPPRFRSQPEALPEPHEMQLHPMHRTWLKQHKKEYDGHVYEVYHALKRVDRAERKDQEIQRQREMTRDMIDRPLLVDIKLPAKAKAGLQKAKLAVQMTRAFNQSVGIDLLGEEEALHRDATLRAKSAPCLALKVPTPRHRPRHLRNWAGPDRRFKWTQTDRCLRHTTPWIAQDEEHEIKTRGIGTMQRSDSR